MAHTLQGNNSAFRFYTGGVITAADGCVDGLDHAIVFVGLGTASVTKTVTTPIYEDQPFTSCRNKTGNPNQTCEQKYGAGYYENESGQCCIDGIE